MLLRDMKCFRLEMTEIGSILEENKLGKIIIIHKNYSTCCIPTRDLLVYRIMLYRDRHTQVAILTVSQWFEIIRSYKVNVTRTLEQQNSS